MANILCVEDSNEFLIYLTSVLSGHSITQASDIKQALSLASTGRGPFDLIILDISLPDGNGLKIIPQLREMNTDYPIPIIVLSNDDDVVTKVAAFGIGADDFVSKPPEPNELRARVEARLRRTLESTSKLNHLRYGDLLIDSNTMRVELSSRTHKTTEVPLTLSEFKILKTLVSRPGQVYSRDQLIDHIWGVDKHVTPRTVDAHVSNLRKKIEDSSVSIETVTGTGYRAKLKDTAPSSHSS